MKKLKKAFTLVELIIVLALFSLLMLAVGGLFKPIVELFNSAKDVFMVNSAVNGITEYLTGNMRFATSIDIYINYEDLPSGAIDDFMLRSGLDKTVNADREKVQVISIFNDTNHGDKWNTHYDATAADPGKTTFIGRMWRSKGVGSHSIAKYEALGFGYYGKQDYNISLKGRVSSEVTDSQNFFVSVVPLNFEDKTTQDGAASYNGTRYLNTSAVVNKNPTAGTKDVNHYIIFTLPE